MTINDKAMADAQASAARNRGNEGLSVLVETGNEAVAALVAPRLARRLYPWLDRSTLTVLHMAPGEHPQTTEVVLKVHRPGPGEKR